ncbi:uncharacterized protein N7484_009895 [Penicillium longicatenatum]|uniref:uncharacterized protein n=1 Tax=Penicillium longicatenatum TaxID=1561947 RepID=UPI002549A078|nr:uncharacterized protein N7484_009895 [Penicillium longicatenatum]KAJ5636582.1 hypothetical protein N7484_009895 [Penicillium longicatenatum]
MRIWWLGFCANFDQPWRDYAALSGHQRGPGLVRNDALSLHDGGGAVGSDNASGCILFGIQSEV